MLHYFPKVYPDELLYSVLARYAIHRGLTSPKLTLDELFGHRHVMATVDLPGQLTTLLNQVGSWWQVSVDDVIDRHTLFPLYAPFISDQRRREGRALMTTSPAMGLHTGLGVAASIVKTPSYLRYCPQCLTQDIACYGEYYWRRLFQVTGCNVCPIHTCALHNSSVNFQGRHGHLFVGATPDTCINLEDQLPRSDTGSMPEIALAKVIDQLLSLHLVSSPTLHQWTLFYRQLAGTVGATHGRVIDYGELTTAIGLKWSAKWLGIHGCGLHQARKTTWLHGLFRKHRKAFSYLHHGMMWVTFYPERTVSEILDEVTHYPVEKPRLVARPSSICDQPPVQRYRAQWLQHLELTQRTGVGIPHARKHPPGGALYAWLYRHDREWLIESNRCFHVRDSKRCQRINWKRRDRVIARQLIAINRCIVDELATPRRTQGWYLRQVPRHGSMDKWISRMPLTQAFMTRYAESVADHQIRRCTLSAVKLINTQIPITRWRIERMAGLSQQRERPETQLFLQWIEEWRSEQSQHQTNSK